MPFPAHCASVVLPSCENERVVIQGLPHPPQYLAMLQHTRCLFLKETQAFMEEEMEEETEINYFTSFTLRERSLQPLFGQRMQYCLSPGLQTALSKNNRVSRCLICPWLGTSPRPRSKQSLALTVPLLQGLCGTDFLLAAVSTSPVRVFTREIRWVKGVQSKSFSKSHLLIALCWRTSVNKPCRKPGW